MKNIVMQMEWFYGAIYYFKWKIFIFSYSFYFYFY